VRSPSPLDEADVIEDAPERPAIKSAAAFRTISEVSDDLNVPQHVLRFWETKFPQIRPLKRGGGRRYYRPEDVELLGKIGRLLYQEGYTIRGVQRLLREGALKSSGRQAAAEQGPPPTLPLGFLDFVETDPVDDFGAEEPEPEPAPRRRGANLGPNTQDQAMLRALLEELRQLRALLPPRRD
jgi:DNA-binding transcriptional MerR regulator